MSHTPWVPPDCHSKCLDFLSRFVCGTAQVPTIVQRAASASNTQLPPSMPAGQASRFLQALEMWAVWYCGGTAVAEFARPLLQLGRQWRSDDMPTFAATLHNQVIVPISLLPRPAPDL